MHELNGNGKQIERLMPVLECPKSFTSKVESGNKNLLNQEKMGNGKENELKCMPLQSRLIFKRGFLFSKQWQKIVL